MPDFDPRYDPAFQRGYAPPPASAPPPAAPAPAPAASAPAASARMKEIPRLEPDEGDPAGVSLETPSFGRTGAPADAGAQDVSEAGAEPGPDPDAVAAGPSAAARPASRTPLPWTVALAVLSAAAVVAGVWGLVTLAAPVRQSLAAAESIDETARRVTIELLSAPLLVGGCVGLAVALVLLSLVVGRRDRSTA